MSAERPTAREFAALAYAVGVLRGHLHGVIMGELDLAHMRQALEGTPSSNIARTLGLGESNLDIDWNKYLSEGEKRAIQGALGD
jgi:hypothetical protein